MQKRLNWKKIQKGIQMWNTKLSWRKTKKSSFLGTLKWQDCIDQWNAKEKARVCQSFKGK
jgi:hypothetical protein